MTDKAQPKLDPVVAAALKDWHDQVAKQCVGMDRMQLETTKQAVDYAYDHLISGKIEKKQFDQAVSKMSNAELARRSVQNDWDLKGK